MARFTQYFPYILLIAALLLAGIEKFFKKIFKSSLQIEGFHSLLLTARKITTSEETSEVSMEDTIHTVEVRQSFKNNSSFHTSYVVRTLCEFLVSLLLTVYMLLSGVGELERDSSVLCDVHGTWYECSGVPTQFYLSVLFIALALLAVYLLTTFFTLLWLLCPCWGKLATFMRDYQAQLSKNAKKAGMEMKDAELLGELNQIYYENNDLRLLLDLLAAATGLAPPLR